MVRVVLHGHLRQFAEGRRELEIDAAGSTARAVLERIGVPEDEAAALMVDEEQEELDRILRDGETLELIPAITGGRRPPKFPPELNDMLLSEERRAHIDPARALGEFGVREAATLADLGCGPGFFTIPAAKIVGPRGHVHAADVQAEMLERVREAAAANRLANIETHLVREEPRGEGWSYDLGVPAGSCDLALVAFVLHEAEDPASFLRAAGALLKPSGRIAVLQWEKRDTYAGPAVQVRMTPEETLAAVREAGLDAHPAPSLDPDHYAFFLRP
jgi:SAM-dependent methyltransferase